MSDQPENAPLSVSAPPISYPASQSGSKFRYLGRQRVDGHETDVVAFAQIPARADLVGSFKIGKYSAPTFQQGLAWIDPQTQQILRLRTDLLKPLPEVRLSEVTTQIDYQKVSFKNLGRGLWLPKNVTVTVAWNGKHSAMSTSIRTSSSSTFARQKKLDVPRAQNK